MDQQKIGKFISDKRKEKKLTQTQLGELLHVSKNAVSKWERGICMMDIALLEPLANILEVSVTELLNGEEYTVNPKEQTSVETALKIAEEQIKKYDYLIFVIGIAIILAILIWPILYEKQTGRNFIEIYYIVYPLSFMLYVICYGRIMIKQKKLSIVYIAIVIGYFIIMLTNMKMASNLLPWL